MDQKSWRQSGQVESPLTVGLVSLGCPKNLVESETLLAELAEAGLVLTGEYSEADVLLVNTCGFLQSAQEEGAGVIGRLSRYKAPRGRCRCLIVFGCWSQIAGEQILERFKAVDAAVGVNDRRNIVGLIQTILGGRKDRRAMVRSRVQPFGPEATRFRLTPSHWCYLRISEGCSQRCTFCSIPDIRGGYRSKPLGSIVAEARALAADGARELILIGQETTNYGRDLGVKDGLARLLSRLDRVPGVDWIRLMYTYPANFSDTTIRAIAGLERVVKYVDMPLQHISDCVLHRMGRRIDRAETLALLDKLRTAIPDLTLRTTLIVGFPGETEVEFRELLAFVAAYRFDALGAFAYSPEPGTAAAGMKDQVPDAVKLDRLDRLMRLQRKIAFAKAREQIGRRFDVVLEPTPVGRKYLIARSVRQAPQVDPVTLVPRARLAAKYAVAGSRIPVQCIGSRGYDLVAEPLKKKVR